ncbi:hypothetical protein FQZ97_995970 [compost metagenome]
MHDEIGICGGAALERTGQYTENFGLVAGFLKHLAKGGLLRGVARNGPALGKRPDIAIEVIGGFAQQDLAGAAQQNPSVGAGLSNVPGHVEPSPA